MNKLVKEELNAMKYLLGYQRGKVISEQTNPPAPAAAPAATTPATVEDAIKQLQTILNTKFGAKLTVDGKWGNLTQTAFESAVKSKSAAPASQTGTAAPAASTTTAAPASQTGTAAVSPTPDEVVSTEVVPQSNRDQRRARQDLRRGNRRAMQDLRGQQRAQ